MFVGEVVGVDGWGVGRVGGVDVHATPVEGVYDGGNKGEEALSVERRGSYRVALYPGIAVGEDDFELGDGGVGEEGELLLVDGGGGGANGLLGQGEEVRGSAAKGFGPVQEGVAAAGVVVHGVLAGPP